MCRSSGKTARKGRMAQHMAEQRTENIAVEVFSTSTHVDKPQILLKISNIDLKAFKVDVNALLYHNTPTTLPSAIDCNVIEKCDRDLQSVLGQYAAVFAPGLGLCSKVHGFY